MPGFAAATALDTVICVLTRDNSGSLMPIEHGNWNGVEGGGEGGGYKVCLGHVGRFMLC